MIDLGKTSGGGTMRVNLTARDATVQLESDASGWCYVRLIDQGGVRALGADMLRIVAERLTAALQPSLEPTPPEHVGQRGRRWVLTLMEEHATILACDRDGRRVLEIVGADGGMLVSIELTPSERDEWRSALQDALVRVGS